MPSPDFRIQYRWKEEVIYWEGDRGFSFDAGWGAEPPALYVPAPQVWDAVTPAWMHGRRDEIVQRLARHSRHEVFDDPNDRVLEWRWLTAE